MTSRILPWLETIDTGQFGRRRAGAVYLVRGRRLAVVETGTARAAPDWIGRLRRERIAYIVLTHVHLDHAGGAGLIAREHPEATVVVHPRGAGHLVDPRRLVAGTRSASPGMFPLYGDPVPISAERIHAAADGETFDLGGGVALQAIESSGHAPHHLCFFEPGSRCLFSGDALGHHGIPAAVPLTVPPRFDLDSAMDTLDRLFALDPSRVAFTHFGVVSGGRRLIEEYRVSLIEWLGRIRALGNRLSDDEVVRAILEQPENRRLSALDQQMVEMCVRGALGSLDRLSAGSERKEPGRPPEGGAP
jgi:glyoxylase-like metal-dependent hydrolase (beta-lactamase superfamily II)